MESKIEEDLCCPICQDIFQDPVILSCSHSFCKACLQDWWEDKEVKECPVCKRRYSKGFLPSNLSLRNLCETFLQQRGQTAPEELCSLHSEKVKLFCLDHQEPVCVVCRDSEKHSSHKFRPISEAARQHKETLRNTLQPLKEKLKGYKDVQVKFDQTFQHVQDQARHTERQIKEQFKNLHQFLKEEEEARLCALREEEEQKSRRMKKEMEALSRKIEALSDTVRAAEEELAAEDVSFLKNYKVTVKRVHQCPLLGDQQLPLGALIDVAKHLGNLGFKVWKKMKDMVPYTPVILDPNTAYPDLILSDSLTTMSLGEEQKLPENPERVYYTCSILGSEGFESGSHSWEVDVGDIEEWSLGVLAASANRKGNIIPGLWRLWFSGGKYRALCPLEPVTVLELKEKLQRIRVNLDHNQGELLFSEAGTNKHIHTFIHSFSEKVFPYFRNGNELPLKVLPAMVPVNVEKLMHEYEDDDSDEEVDILNLMRAKKYNEIWGKVK